MKMHRNIYNMEGLNNNVVKEGLRRIFSSKPVVHLAIFIALGLIMVIAGNVIVQDGTLTTADNLTVGGELIGSRSIICFTDPDYKTASSFGYFQGVSTDTNSAPVMWRSGKIVGYSVNLNIVNATTGSLAMKLKRVYPNGSNSDLAGFDFYTGLGTGWASNYTTFARSSAPSFSAGDKLGIRENENGNMGWDDIIACAEVQFDS